MDRRKALKLSGVIAGITTLPITVGMIQSCRPTGAIDWIPSFFTKNEAKAIENLSEIILPSSSDNPGAKDVHVAEFIDRIVNDCMSSSEQEKMQNGLSAIDAYCSAQSGITLDQNTTSKSISCIKQLDQEAFTGKTEDVHDSYRELKQLVLLGFFTSEKVMTTALNYQPIPGKYIGCVPLSDDPRVSIGNNVAG